MGGDLRVYSQLYRIGEEENIHPLFPPHPTHPHFPNIKMIVHCKRLCLTDIIKVLIDSETFNQETIIVSLFDLFKGPFVYRLKQLWGEGGSAILSNK